MTTPLRIALFIDAQNAYRRARDRFFPNPQSNVDGQFPDQAGPVDREQRRPRRPALLPVRCAFTPVGRTRTGTSAHMRQSNRWRANGATVITQGLRYPPTWPTDPAKENCCGLRHSPKSFWPAAPKLAPFSDDEPTVPRFHAPRHPKLAAALVVRLPWSSSSGLLTRRIPHREYYYNELQLHHTRNLAGNPDSPQAVIFLTSITDVMMGS